MLFLWKAFQFWMLRCSQKYHTCGRAYTWQVVYSYMHMSTQTLTTPHTYSWHLSLHYTHTPDTSQYPTLHTYSWHLSIHYTTHILLTPLNTLHYTHTPDTSQYHTLYTYSWHLSIPYTTHILLTPLNTLPYTHTPDTLSGSHNASSRPSRFGLPPSAFKATLAPVSLSEA